MTLFRELPPHEKAYFRAWARENYKPFSEISGLWHPAVIDECARINQQASDFFDECNLFEESQAAE